MTNCYDTGKTEHVLNKKKKTGGKPRTSEKKGPAPSRGLKTKGTRAKGKMSKRRTKTGAGCYTVYPSRIFVGKPEAGMRECAIV